jgi:dihydroorotate dehydrogenase
MQLVARDGRQLPILVKVSPDLASEDLAAIARLVEI